MERAKFILQVVQTLIWPTFGIFLVLILRTPIIAILKNSRLSSVALPGGVVITLDQLKSAAAAGIAVGKQDASTQTDTKAAVQNIAQAISRSSPSGNRQRMGSVLWVDDIPSNNSSLVGAFQAIGIQVKEVLSTDEALDALKSERFDLIISDMGRPSDGEAGLTLVAELRKRDIGLPVVIFAANWARVHKGQEGEYDVLKITNDGSVVYSTVLNELSRKLA